MPNQHSAQTELMPDRMAVLIFGGIVCSGLGRHSTLLIPGRSALPSAPVDWPETLYTGSLNVRIDQYPAEFGERGLKEQVVELDRGWFAPEFEILRGQFGNNLLGPSPGVPRGGDAQVWRATLSLLDSETEHGCWMLRRFGSQVGEQLEFVAAHRLRDRLRDGGIEDGERV